MTDSGFDERRMRWMSRRGMKELDVLLAAYLDQRWPEAPAEEKAAFARLLEHQDPELWSWLSGQAEPGERELADVVSWIRSSRPT